jgi:hypothetical protein
LEAAAGVEPAIEILQTGGAGQSLVALYEGAARGQIRAAEGSTSGTLAARAGGDVGNRSAGAFEWVIRQKTETWEGFLARRCGLRFWRTCRYAGQNRTPEQVVWPRAHKSLSQNG